ncbi:hypothetical protein LXL04_034231 [Taraxacum kok-saghyz]
MIHKKNHEKYFHYIKHLKVLLHSYISKIAKIDFKIVEVCERTFPIPTMIVDDPWVILYKSVHQDNYINMIFYSNKKYCYHFKIIFSEADFPLLNPEYIDYILTLSYHFENKRLTNHLSLDWTRLFYSFKEYTFKVLKEKQPLLGQSSGWELIMITKRMKYGLKIKQDEIKEVGDQLNKWIICGWTPIIAELNICIFPEHHSMSTCKKELQSTIFAYSLSDTSWVSGTSSFSTYLTRSRVLVESEQLFSNHDFRTSVWQAHMMEQTRRIVSILKATKIIPQYGNLIVQEKLTVAAFKDEKNPAGELLCLMRFELVVFIVPSADEFPILSTVLLACDSRSLQERGNRRIRFRPGHSRRMSSEQNGNALTSFQFVRHVHTVADIDIDFDSGYHFGCSCDNVHDDCSWNKNRKKSTPETEYA